MTQKYDPSDLYRDTGDLTDLIESAEVIQEGDEAARLAFTDDAPDETRFVAPEEEIHMTDLGNARMLVRAVGHDYRWCGASLGTGWRRWTGARWENDDTRQITQAAMRVADEWREQAPPECTDLVLSAAEEKIQKRRGVILKHALRCESAGAIRAIVDLAGAQPDIVTRAGEWDADPWLYNTPDRTFDLRAMTARPPRRSDRITRIGGVGAGDNADCPVWMAFLRRIMGGDEEMVRFLQRVAGYCLTGSTAEQCLFIAYGRGANGKSTFMDILAHILGDYAKSTQIETFTSRKEGSIPNDLAALVGVRLVTCSEPSEGAPIHEGLVKLATGGDRITCRFLNKEFFDYLPLFKIIMLTNHKPVVRGTDMGIWRRLVLIPFEVTIPANERDGDLPAKLRREAPGILRWMLDGCKEWARIGLDRPARVLAATEEYREEMDVLAEFLADKCDTGANESIDNTALYAAYSEWMKRSGGVPKAQRGFTIALKERGFKQHADRSKGRRWVGIGLRLSPMGGGRWEGELMH